MHFKASSYAWAPNCSVRLCLQAIEEETERADRVHAQEQADLRRALEEYEKEVLSWKVQCFDQQYERWVAAVGITVRISLMCVSPQVRVIHASGGGDDDDDVCKCTVCKCTVFFLFGAYAHMRTCECDCAFAYAYTHSSSASKLVQHVVQMVEPFASIDIGRMCLQLTGAAARAHQPTCEGTNVVVTATRIYTSHSAPMHNAPHARRERQGASVQAAVEAAEEAKRQMRQMQVSDTLHALVHVCFFVHFFLVQRLASHHQYTRQAVLKTQSRHRHMPATQSLPKHACTVVPRHSSLFEATLAVSMLFCCVKLFALCSNTGRSPLARRPPRQHVLPQLAHSHSLHAAPHTPHRLSTARLWSSPRSTKRL